MSTNFCYYQFPKEIIKRAQKELTGSQFKILSAIISEIVKWPEYRENLTKELSCRYLSEILNIHYSHIAKAIKKLEDLQFIKVLKKGTKATGGSIIKLIISVAEKATEACFKVAKPATMVQEPDLKKITISEKTIIQGEKLFKEAPLMS